MLQIQVKNSPLQMKRGMNPGRPQPRREKGEFDKLFKFNQPSVPTEEAGARTLETNKKLPLCKKEFRRGIERPDASGVPLKQGINKNSLL
jgi:hypothetical protein